MSIKTFLTEVETHLKAGNATEHTYRPALEKLFNSLLAPAKATNEPKHEAYGAPDFIIQQGNTPIGHVEAKDIGIAMATVIADSERETPRTDNAGNSSAIERPCRTCSTPMGWNGIGSSVVSRALTSHCVLPHGIKARRSSV